MIGYLGSSPFWLPVMIGETLVMEQAIGIRI